MSPAILAADGIVPRLEVGDVLRTAFEWVRDNLSFVFGPIRDAVASFTNGLADLLNLPNALIMVAIFSLLAWLARDWKLAVLSAAMLTFVITVDQWEHAMITLAMILVASAAAVLVGVPLGIASAQSQRVSRMVRPLMDLMQTMPAFVWLIPVLVLFRVGMTPGVIATFIFCLAPAVRLTELGIRQVDPEVVEAGHAFGSTRGQILRRIQLPLAVPTIMAGINQVIMLALSMAVIAGLVGARGLGQQVVSALGNLDLSLAFEAGLSVVVLAIYLDRVTSALGERQPGGSGRWSLLRAVRRGGGVRAVEAGGDGEPAPATVPEDSNRTNPGLDPDSENRVAATSGDSR